MFRVLHKLSSCLSTVFLLVSAKKLTNKLQTSVGLQLQSVWAYSFYPNLKYDERNPKHLIRLAEKHLVGIRAEFMGYVCLMMHFPFFIWVIGHMKVKDQRQRFEFFDREVASVVYNAARSCYVQPHMLHDECSEDGLSLFHSFCTKLTADNDQTLFVFFLFWWVISKREDQGWTPPFSLVKHI